MQVYFHDVWYKELNLIVSSFCNSKTCGSAWGDQKIAPERSCQAVDQRFTRHSGSVQEIEVQRLFESPTWVQVDFFQNMLISIYRSYRLWIIHP